MSTSFYHFLALSLVISPPVYFHNYIIYFKDCKNWTNQKRGWLVIRPRPNNIYGDRIVIAFCLFDRPWPYSPANILFSLSASYNLIIFYELALLLVVCPFPPFYFHYPRPITLLFSTNHPFHWLSAPSPPFYFHNYIINFNNYISYKSWSTTQPIYTLYENKRVR